MKVRKWLLLIVGLAVMLVTAAARAQSSNGDRVYTGDQTSNTVSVIDPATQNCSELSDWATPCQAR